MVTTNGWDPAVLERFRADPVVSGFLGGIDSNATTEQLEHIATLIPERVAARPAPPARPSSVPPPSGGSWPWGATA